jgi:Ca-activated chloride channel family protein
MRVQLRRADEIPNKDFILRYSVATDTIQDGFIAHTGEKGGFFTLFLMPPAQPGPSQIAPREVIFVVDQSGSQSGFPIDKSKELTLQLIKTLHPADTFNVLGFSNSVNPLWKQARLNTPENIAAATKFVSALQANGGTQLRDAAVAALSAPDDPSRLRLVVFNTDGFVGDEAAILKSIHEHCNRSRMFTFGIGNSVNRYLLEEMAIAGRGDVEIVTLAEKADEAVSKFIARSENPVLTDVSVNIEGVEIETMLPGALPDVFSERPVVVMGRYSTPGTKSVTISGKLGGRPWSRNIEIDFPAQASAPALESMWARRKVDELTRKTFLANILPEGDRATKEEVIDLALEFGIMTEYTSFVAVEKRIVNVGGKQRTVAVPIEMADGVSYEGIFGRRGETAAFYRGGAPAPASKAMSGGAGGFGGGAGGSIQYEAVDNSIIVRADDSAMTPEQRRRHRYETKVSKELREAKGTVEVQMYFTKLSQPVIDKLVKLGLKVEFSDNGLKVAMGTCDQKALLELAQIEEVDKIVKLK